jgi:hypothetical protein
MYNGHKNWNHWNVSLWINNDEGLYAVARYWAQRRNRTVATQRILEELKLNGRTHTPDGAPYSLSSIRAALVGTNKRVTVTRNQGERR